MSNAPATSPATSILAQHFGPRAVVSTFALPEDHSPSPSERVGVCVGWTARPAYKAPGLVPTPVLVLPVPEMGTFRVSYRQAVVESTLLDLPAAVDRLIDMAQTGAYWARSRRQVEALAAVS
jgi:hypothetical protein